MTATEILQKNAEEGRRYKIALEVWHEFLTGRREHLVFLLENNEYHEEDLKLHDLLAELRVIAEFRRCAEQGIKHCKFSEDALREISGENPGNEGDNT